MFPHGSAALVVDDQAFVRKTVSAALNTLGYDRIHEAENGLQAIDLLKKNPRAFDLVICDLNMPEQDGLVAIERLSDLEYVPSLILISGDDSAVLSVAKSLAINAGLPLLGVIEKPVTIEKLKKALSGEAHDTHRQAGAPLPKVTYQEIHDGIKEGAFKPYFQPQIDMASSQICGVEALARMFHPQRGVIAPSAFIDTAEQQGSIGLLTEDILRQSFRWAAEWRSDGMNLTMSVNVSAADLTNTDFPDAVLKTAKQFNVPPESIILELTETSISKNPEKLLHVVARLRLMKFQISVDDFGTGFSSLEQLRNLPFHELKVDQTFVMKAASDAKSASILEASFDLAQRLGLRSVAEGVETEASYSHIKQMGFDVGQGYFMARPMPPEELIPWIMDWNKTHNA